MFDFSKESKEKYYKQAEEYLSQNGLTCFVVDRNQIGYQRTEQKIKVYLVPFTKYTVSRRELEKAKALKKLVITNDRDSKRKNGEAHTMRENGYIVLDLEASN